MKYNVERNDYNKLAEREMARSCLAKQSHPQDDLSSWDNIGGVVQCHGVSVMWQS